MRKTLLVTIVAEGRDQGKTFMLTEMPVRQSERWAFRALFVLAKYMNLPEHIMSAGMAGVAQLSPSAMLSVPFEQVEPLLDEMMACVKIIRDTRHPEMTFQLTDDDVEEIATLLFLRSKVWELHTGFSWADSLLKWMSARTQPQADLSDTPTSPPLSAQ